MNGLRVLTLTACLLALAAAQPGAHADDAGEPPRFAVFSGTATPLSGGTASRCHEIVTGGPIMPFTCDASFEITVAGGVCAVTANETAGTFDYFSHTTGYSFRDVPLKTTASNGAGYLVGYGFYGTRFLHVRISVAALCAPQASGPFEGHLAYV